MEMKSSGLFLPHYRSISEQNVQEIGSLHQNFLLTKCQNFTLIDAKIPKWYIIKKLRKISRDFLCYIHEAASFFSRRKKASYSYSIFHVDLSEYPSSSSMSSSSANYPSNCLTDSDSSSSSDENVESIFSDQYCNYVNIIDFDDSLIKKHIKDDMVRLIHNLIDKAIPVIIDGKLIEVDHDYYSSSEESTNTPIIAINDFQTDSELLPSQNS